MIQSPYEDSHVNKSLDFNYRLSTAPKDREQEILQTCFYSTTKIFLSGACFIRHPVPSSFFRVHLRTKSINNSSLLCPLKYNLEAAKRWGNRLTWSTVTLGFKFYCRDYPNSQSLPMIIQLRPQSCFLLFILLCEYFFECDIFFYYSIKV